ncbi:MAG TPA: TetR/AcrR family transcriptional regulator [Solirubrobacteraceae bacterium]|jgi:AcrR family transcriptional regulator
MTRQGPPRESPRARRLRGSLTPKEILDAAEAIAGDGFEALSVRAVAARIESAPMALYNHFATKDRLVDALLDRVLSRFAPAPPTSDWIEDLRRFARAHRRLLDAHPWALAPLLRRPNPGLGAVRIGEAALAILAQGGLAGAEAVAAFSGIVALNYGWSSFTAHRGGTGEDVGATLAALPRSEFPLTAGVAGEMGAYGSDRHYELVLDQLLRGLEAGSQPRP